MDKKLEDLTISKDEDLEVRFGDDIESAPIKLCVEHNEDLYKALCVQGLEPWIAKTNQDVRAAITAKRFEPMIASTEALMKLGLKTIGSIGLIEHGGCPVCALNQFDFIEQMASIMHNVVQQKTGAFTKQ